jgi:hypothetical protein
MREIKFRSEGKVFQKVKEDKERVSVFRKLGRKRESACCLSVKDKVLT